MSPRGCIFCLLLILLVALYGCSSKQAATDSKKTQTALQKIQGTAQVLIEGGPSDAALNAGRNSSLYLWQGERRYRLFLRTPVEIEHGHEYVAEGIYAQKAIDEIGDPDQGKNGYPLEESCARVVRMAWSGLPFDAVDAHAAALRARVKRYPARAVFLVTRIREVTPAESSGLKTEQQKQEAKAALKSIREVSIPWEKERAFLVEGTPPVFPAPLWNPEGGTVKCEVVIGPDGKISRLETGAQLCESVEWSKFTYKPQVQDGRPVKVRTEVEVKFEPRK